MDAVATVLHNATAMGAFARVVDHAQPSRLDTLAGIVRGEFAEMPGMRLTKSQFRRLWNLRSPDDEALIAVLVAQGFLVEGRDGRLARRIDLL
jgi:hypothetical protein